MDFFLKAYKTLTITDINSFWSIPRLFYVGDFKCTGSIFNSDQQAWAFKIYFTELRQGQGWKHGNLIWGDFGASDYFAET